MNRCLVLLSCGVMLLGGCSTWKIPPLSREKLEETETKKGKVELVGDLAVPFGMFPVQVEAVGLISGLHGTGSDPAPGPQRAVLVDEMQTRGVTNPNTILASGDCSLVMVRGVLRPGIQEGDHFDVEVRIPAHSETTSLRGGYLLETRLKEMAVLNNQVHEGRVLALAQGPVMVDPSAKGKEDKVLLGRGRILGGGVARKSRPLGLVLKPGKQNVVNSSRVANAVNKRFHTSEKGVKVGVAKAKTDEFIELAVHPRYKDNVARYVRVVRALAMHESATARVERLADLRKRMADPATAADASLELEAMGVEGVDCLLEAVKSDDFEVRFYAAEALAYLDRREAAKPLGDTARREPAFRVFALTALSAMDDYAAYEQLREMLDLPSAETRYGAFRALWAMNPNDPLVVGERLADQFSYHVLDTTGPPMLHATRSRRPEIVVFGRQQQFLLPLSVNAGNEILVTQCGADQISVSRYAAGKPDQKRVVAPTVDAVVRAIAELGGTYPDVVQALQEAKTAGALSGRFEVDALPEAGRTYERSGEPGARVSQEPAKRAASPMPDLFTGPSGGKPSQNNGPDAKSEPVGPDCPDSTENRKPSRGFFDKMMRSSAD